MRGAVDAATLRLEQAGVPGSRREATRLLAWVMNTDRGGVLARGPDPLPSDLEAPFEALVSRRERREPFQYLVGEEEFLGFSFTVDRRVLIPRPETEIVVEAALGLPLGPRARVLDLGTGSGCIAVALARSRPGWRIVALDRSAEALGVARLNVERHGVATRVELVEGDLSDAASVGSPFDLVVSNPPYVTEQEWRGLAPEVRDHEPKAALVPGPTGLEAYRAIAPASPGALAAGGFLVLELGYRSLEGAREAVIAAGFDEIEVRPDLRGISRVLVARCKLVSP